MSDEQTKTTDTQGATNNSDNEKPLSIVEEARAIRDEIVKAKEELKAQNDRAESIQANNLLGGTSGGHVEAPLISPEDAKKAGAKEFFKGTALEGAIDKL